MRNVAIWLAALIAAPAMAEPPPLSLYGNLPGIELGAVSPSGEHVALIGNDGHGRKLIVLDGAGKPVRIAVLGDQKIRALHFAGDGMVLVEASATSSLGIGFIADKAELTGMLVVPLSGGQQYAVFKRQSQIVGGIAGFYGTVQRDGRWYGYFGGMTTDRQQGFDAVLNSTSPALYEVELDSGRVQAIAPRAEDPLSRRSWLIGADGRVAAMLDVNDRGAWRLRNGANARIAGGDNPIGAVSLVGLGSAPGSVIYATRDAATHADHWYQLPLAGGAQQEVFADTGIEASLFDRGHRLIGYEADGDLPTYHLFDAHRQKVVDAAAKAFPGLAMHLVDWNDAFDRLLVMTEGSGDSQSWWLIDIAGHHAEQLGVAYPMPAEAVGPVSMVHYTAADGQKIDAVLTLPPGRTAKNLPVVVLPHGGPEARDYPRFDWWAQAFASRGYAVLQPNFRGSTGYGAAFVLAGHGQWGRKMQSDISTGLARLAADGIADPKRACIVGASYGGYAALAGVTLQHGIYRCAVAVAGIGDLPRMTATDIRESGDSQTLARGLKAEIGSGADLAAVSPIRFAAAADAPVLLIHGKDDTVVAYAQSEAMAHALRAAGKPVELVTLPGEDHWLSKSATRLAMLQAAVAFVEKYDPAD